MGIAQSKKAGVIIEMLGSELAARLFVELSQKDQRALIRSLASERLPLSEDEIAETCSEFIRLVQSRSGPGASIVAGHFTSFAGIELPRVPRVGDICDQIPDWILVDYLKGQLDAVASAVLGLVEPTRAGRLFKAIPEERHAQLIVSLSNERVLEATSLDELEADLEELAAKSAHGRYGQRVGGADRIVALVQALDGELRDKLLYELNDREPVLAQHLEASLLSVERLAGLIPSQLAVVLAQMKDSDVGSFLRGEKERTQETYLACVSSRRKCEIECLLEPSRVITRQQKAEACEKLRSCAQKLKDEGKIVFPWEQSLVS